MFQKTRRALLFYSTFVMTAIGLLFGGITKAQAAAHQHEHEKQEDATKYMPFPWDEDLDGDGYCDYCGAEMES